MEQSIRVLTWNCRRASSKSELWDYLLEIDPDVALLQDFGTIPEGVLRHYHFAQNVVPAKTGRAPRYMTGILVRGVETADLPLLAPIEWVAQELENFKEFFTAKEVRLQNGINLKVMSVYSPAFPIDRIRLKGIDTTGIQLTQNKELWVTELMCATLKSMDISTEDQFIVAGDLNSSETFDYLWRGGPSGNREIMDRMNALGFYDCLRMFKGQLTPTFRHSRKSFIHQLDHLYVTPRLLSRLTQCDVGSTDRVFGSTPSLSDHLPIVADFALPN